jgi:predicted secreted Zn-dependent protease
METTRFAASIDRLWGKRFDGITEVEEVHGSRRLGC